jgi:uncharacterized protein YqfA (UPF0365 family)
MSRLMTAFSLAGAAALLIVALFVFIIAGSIPLAIAAGAGGVALASAALTSMRNNRHLPSTSAPASRDPTTPK